MVLLFHIGIALLSVAFATYLYFFPSKTKVNITYGLMALTLGSGTYLIWDLKTHVLQSCVMGLAYAFGVSTAVVLANKKLAADSLNK